MALKCGIVGLPNVGKSTLFNCLSNAKAQSANFPFCTIEPNIGVITVPDPRLEKLEELAQPQRVLPTTMEIVDIAGLVKGASKGEGLGNQFLANIRETDAIITTPKYFEQITGDTDVCKVTDTSCTPVQKSLIKVFFRNGPYRSFWYTPQTMDMTDMVPIGDQAPIVAETVRLYNAKGRAVIFIHGVTGAGKSSVGYMIAKEIGANYTNTFRPTDPGDSFGNLLSELRSRHDVELPLVIVLEEANLMIHAIHEGTIERHREIPVPISDKTNWVGFFDNLIFYRNIVVILTSNESKDALDALDPAYLRKGRVDATFSMMTALDI